jgi:hypothetical protein
MGHKNRTYDVIEAVTGGPPHTTPVLGQNGHVLPSDQLLIFNKNTDKLKKVDHYRIRFDIKHFSKSPLRFTPNKSDVLWVKKAAGPSNCPTSPCHDMPDTFWVDEMDEDGEWIDVINMDMTQEEFWFTLNLVDKNNPTSTTYVALDPGGGNQNGGVAGSDFTLSWLGPTLLGVCAGLVAFFGAGLLLT